MSEYIISYEHGYSNWYVSEFYKFFHKKIEEKTGILFDYISLNDLSKKMGYEFNNSNDTLFNWFNLLIINKKTEKIFVHSWYDYAQVTIDWCVKNKLNIVKFSCVSNLSDEYINKYDFVQPSVYCLENWNDHLLIDKFKDKIKNNKKIYFAGLSHGIRENIMNKLKENDNFQIYSRREPLQNKQKETYFDELCKHKYGLSLNGAANICYRDLELFGLSVLNIREKLVARTFNPILHGVHYLEIIDENFIKKIIDNENVENDIKEKIDFLNEFANSNSYLEMINNSKEWFINNCLPDNQFKIISSFLNELEILN